jgi:hypothetical protein
MNRATHIQPTLAMGFAAQGIGSSCAMRLRKFELTASAQAGVATTQ